MPDNANNARNTRRDGQSRSSTPDPPQLQSSKAPRIQSIDFFNPGIWGSDGRPQPRLSTALDQEQPPRHPAPTNSADRGPKNQAHVPDRSRPISNIFFNPNAWGTQGLPPPAQAEANNSRQPQDRRGNRRDPHQEQLHGTQPPLPERDQERSQKRKSDVSTSPSISRNPHPGSKGRALSQGLRWQMHGSSSPLRHESESKNKFRGIDPEIASVFSGQSSAPTREVQYRRPGARIAVDDWLLDSEPETHGDGKRAGGPTCHPVRSSADDAYVGSTARSESFTRSESKRLIARTNIKDTQEESNHTVIRTNSHVPRSESPLSEVTRSSGTIIIGLGGDRSRSRPVYQRGPRPSSDHHIMASQPQDIFLRPDIKDLWDHAYLLFDNYELQQSLDAFTELANLLPHPRVKVPNAGPLWVDLGILSAHLGEHERAAYFYRMATDAQVEEALFWFLRGTASWELEDWGQAREQFEECLKNFDEGELGIDYSGWGLDFVLRKSEVEWNVNICERWESSKKHKEDVGTQWECYGINRLPGGILFKSMESPSE